MIMKKVIENKLFIIVITKNGKGYELMQKLVQNNGQKSGERSKQYYEDNKERLRKNKSRMIQRIIWGRRKV